MPGSSSWEVAGLSQTGIEDLSREAQLLVSGREWRHHANDVACITAEIASAETDHQTIIQAEALDECPRVAGRCPSFSILYKLNAMQ
jgi:hypothetical protein